jgi:hypothetical protein
VINKLVCGAQKGKTQVRKKFRWPAKKKSINPGFSQGSSAFGKVFEPLISGALCFAAAQMSNPQKYGQAC